MTIHQKINNEIYKAFEKLGANYELLSIIGSYHHTINDDDILDFLKQYNKTGSCFKEVICSVYDMPEDRRKRFKVIT